MTTTKTKPNIKPCDCGCRTLGLRCIRVGDEPEAAALAAERERSAAGMARRLP